MYNRIHFLNAFTANGLGGNPTAVFFSRKPVEAGAMQMLASELPVPVTAFVWEEKGRWRIRYFTALCEIAACGHATLAAAAVGAEVLHGNALCFHTASDRNITASVSESRINLTYPVRFLSPAVAEEALLQSLGLTAADAAEVHACGDTLVLVMADAERIKNLEPDIRRLRRSSHAWDEVVLTAAGGGDGYDYVLRSFCPWIGIDEDPVTGSVQAALAPFWGKRLGKKKLAAHQASPRGGELFLQVNADAVVISGQSVWLTPVLPGAVA